MKLLLIDDQQFVLSRDWNLLQLLGYTTTFKLITYKSLAWKRSVFRGILRVTLLLCTNGINFLSQTQCNEKLYVREFWIILITVSVIFSINSKNKKKTSFKTVD